MRPNPPPSSQLNNTRPWVRQSSDKSRLPLPFCNDRKGGRQLGRSNEGADMLPGGASDNFYGFDDTYAGTSPLGHVAISDDAGNNSMAFWNVQSGVDLNLNLTT